MARSGTSVVVRGWAALAMLASTVLLTASPASAAPGRAYVSNAGSDTVSVVETATNTVLTVIPVGDRPRGLAVTPNGTRVYVANERDDTVSVINTASNTVVATVAVGRDPQSVALTPDGGRAWVATFGGVSVIDTATNTVVGTVLAGTATTDVAINPAGTRAYVTTLFADTLVIIDTATSAVVTSLPTGHTPHDVEVSPDGLRIYVADSIGGLRAYSTTTNTEVARAEFPVSITDVAVSPDSARVFVTQHLPGSGSVLVLDPATLAVVATFTTGLDPSGLGVSPAGDRLYVTGVVPSAGHGRLAVVDTATNAVLAIVAVGDDPQGVAVTAATPPAPPAPVVEGATFYTDGSSARSGAVPGTRVSLFTSSALPGLAYRLVLSRDGCRTTLAVLNTTPRFANASGVIGPTAGFLPPGTPAGRYQICFLAPAGGGSTVTGPVTLDVDPF